MNICGNNPVIRVAVPEFIVHYSLSILHEESR